MTVSTVKSTNITNIEAAPITELKGKINREKVVLDTIELATTSIDEIGDIALFGPIPSNAIINSIVIFNDDLDSHTTPTLAADVGLYYSGRGAQLGVKASGVVVDADCFATAIDTLQSANILGVNVRFERGAGTVADIKDQGLEAWAVAGLTSDPGGEFYVGLTMTAVSATAVAGTVSLQIKYLER